MPHRGRFNVLTNILEYQPRFLFRKVNGLTDTPEELHTVVDDVTSHVSQSIKKTINGK
jgi:probable 2-oxoglutarate dehydrogenase E1 component DHKTD1